MFKNKENIAYFKEVNDVAKDKKPSEKDSSVFLIITLIVLLIIIISSLLLIKRLYGG